MNKTRKSAIIIFTLFFLVNGCGFNKYRTGFEVNGAYKEESGISLIPSHESAISLAKAHEIYSQAQINQAIAETINGRKSGKTDNAENKYIGVIINNNAKYILHVENPFYSQPLEIAPGKCKTIVGPEIPKSIAIRFDNMSNFEPRKIYPEICHYNGVTYDYGTRILY